MKKLGFILLVLVALQSCHKDELPVPYGNVEIKIAFETAYNNFPKENISVQLTEQDGTLVATAQTNSEGKVVFANIVNDVYQVKIGHTFSENVVFPLVGIQQELQFIGETNSLLITANQTTEETVILKTNRVGGFVIKEVYNSNAGGGTISGGIYQYVRFNDSFFEIYNNSPETLYADGLQIGIATNQYETEWKNDSENAYVEQVFKINGSGQQYPVLPGKSIVVAATAINHISADGLSQSQINGLFLFGTVPKSVDLSNANFETYFDGFATNYDINVASVPNLELEFNTYPTIKEIVTTNRGIGLVLFKEVNVASLETVEVERGVNIIRTYQYKKIPTNVIIDAFEAQTTQCFPTEIVGEHLPVLESWEGKSYRRKVSTTINGRRILLDTNSGIADFEELNHATPGTF